VRATQGRAASIGHDQGRPQVRLDLAAQLAAVPAAVGVSDVQIVVEIANFVLDGE